MCDGVVLKVVLVWYLMKEILATTDDGGRCATRDVVMDDKGVVWVWKCVSDDESECEDEVMMLWYCVYGWCVVMVWRLRRGRAFAFAGASGVCVWM